MALLTVRCPRCGHDQKYQPMGGSIETKKKRCVYCGCSFMVHSCLPRSRIVRVESRGREGAESRVGSGVKGGVKGGVESRVEGA